MQQVALVKKLPLGLASLRAHDLHQSLQAAGVDRSRGLLDEELEATQKVGMAAAPATGIKGLDVASPESGDRGSAR